MSFDTDISAPTPTHDAQLQAMLAARPAELADFHAAMNELNEALRVPVDGIDPDTRCYKGFDGRELAQLQMHLQRIKTELGQDVFDNMILSMDARKREALQAYMITKKALARLNQPLKRTKPKPRLSKAKVSRQSEPRSRRYFPWKLRGLDQDKRGSSPTWVKGKVQRLLSQARKEAFPGDYSREIVRPGGLSEHCLPISSTGDRKKMRPAPKDDMLTIVPAIDIEALTYKGPETQNPSSTYPPSQTLTLRPVPGTEPGTRRVLGAGPKGTLKGPSASGPVARLSLWVKEVVRRSLHRHGGGRNKPSKEAPP